LKVGAVLIVIVAEESGSHWLIYNRLPGFYKKSVDLVRQNPFNTTRIAQIAQSVEQRIENPRVGGSIPPLGTITTNPGLCRGFCFFAFSKHFTLIPHKFRFVEIGNKGYL
jgi:hypothetical protein